MVDEFMVVRFFDIDFRGETLMENGTMCSICLTIKLTLNLLLSTESECIK